MKSNVLKKALAILFASTMIIGSCTTAMATQSPEDAQTEENAKPEGSIGGFEQGTQVQGSSVQALQKEVTAAVDKAISDATEKITVEIAENTAIEKDSLAKAKEKGLPVEVKSGKNVWNFDKITSADKDFAPEIKVGIKDETMTEVLKAVPETTKTLQIAFTYDGVLPGKATVEIALPENHGFKEGEVYFYYFNETTKKYELSGKGKIKDDVLTVEMTHCSDYVISDKPLPAAIVTEAKAPTTGDTAPIASMVVILIAGMGVAAVALRKKVKA